MAIARLPGQDAANTSNTTSVTATYASTPTVGNTILASVYANIGTGLGTISGWTQLGQEAFDGGVRQMTVFAKIAGVSESTSVTCSGATLASRMSLHIYEYSGLAASLTLDGTALGATSGISNVASLATGSLTTTNANDLLFIAAAFNGASGTASFSNSFNARQADVVSSLNDADQIVSSTGTYSSTVSTVNTGRAGNLILALQGASVTQTNSGFFLFM